MKRITKRIASLTAVLMSAAALFNPLAHTGISAAEIAEAVFPESPRAEVDDVSYTTADSGSVYIAAENYSAELRMQEMNLLSSEPSIEIADITGDYYVGDIFALGINAENCSYIEYSSSDTSIAEIDSDGNVTLVSAGEVTFTVYGYSSGSVVEDSLTYTVREVSQNNYQFELDDAYDGYTFEGNGYVYESFEIGYTGSGTPTEWTSSDSVATVENGKVVIESYDYYYDNEFTVTITASNEYCTDSITFYVYISAYTTVDMSVYLTLYDNLQNSDLVIGNGFNLDYSSHGVSSIDWTSSDTNVASVDEKGYITINGYGEVTITATAYGYYGYSDSDSITFTVMEPPVINLKQPDSAQLIALNAFNIEYTGTNISRIVWTTSDEAIATILDDGRVKLVGYGTVTITATVYNSQGFSAADSVTFAVTSSTLPPVVPTLIPSDITLIVDSTAELTMVNAPEDTEIKWSSDNTSVVTVTDGKLTGIGAGSATVYAIAGSHVCTCKVTVVGTVENIGDADGDGVVNSSDASKVLAVYVIIATGGDAELTEYQLIAADVNKDEFIDATDASSILAYYAYTATGGSATIEDFLNI